MDNLRKERGSVSLEALISLQLLLLLLVVSWSVAQVIYEYSMASGAAQAAAQSAVQEFDRSVPTRCQDDTDPSVESLCESARARSINLAKTIFSSNFCSNQGRLSGQEDCLSSDPVMVRIRCSSVQGSDPRALEEAEDIEDLDPNLWKNCIRTSSFKIVVIRATVERSINFSGIAFLNNIVPDIEVSARAFAWRALESE